MSTMKISSSLAFLIFAISSAHANAAVLDCGKLLDVKSGELREKLTITIENGKIKSITPTASTKPSNNTIDLKNYTCLPGLMDMHVHLFGESKPQAEQFRNAVSLDTADIALSAVKLAERTLMAGFTTVRDLGAAAGLNISIKRAINQGDIVGPRMFTAGKSIATTGGHGDPTSGLSQAMRRMVGKPGADNGVINGVDSAREAVRTRYQEGADLIKITATGGVLSQASSGENTQFTDEELKAIMSTAKDYGFRVAAHAHGNEGIKRALRAGIHSIEHGTYMDDEAIALFKKMGAWYVPTISAGRFVAEKAKLPDYFSPLVKPKAAAIGPKIQDTFSRAYKAGVKIAFGTDAGVFQHGENAKEFGYMVESGMPALAAIRSATLNAAELLNQDLAIGSIEPNYIADIIAVKGNPLKDIQTLEKVDFVMKDGVVYKKPVAQ